MVTTVSHVHTSLAQTFSLTNHDPISPPASTRPWRRGGRPDRRGRRDGQRLLLDRLAGHRGGRSGRLGRRLLHSLAGISLQFRFSAPTVRGRRLLCLWTCRRHLVSRRSLRRRRRPPPPPTSPWRKPRVADARMKLKDIGAEMKNLKKLAFNMDGKLDSIQDKQIDHIDPMIKEGQVYYMEVYEV